LQTSHCLSCDLTTNIKIKGQGNSDSEGNTLQGERLGFWVQISGKGTDYSTSPCPDRLRSLSPIRTYPENIVGSFHGGKAAGT
jgi:hypothetical protein